MRSLVITPRRHPLGAGTFPSYHACVPYSSPLDAIGHPLGAGARHRHRGPGQGQEGPARVRAHGRRHHRLRARRLQARLAPQVGLSRRTAEAEARGCGAWHARGGGARGGGEGSLEQAACCGERDQEGREVPRCEDTGLRREDGSSRDAGSLGVRWVGGWWCGESGEWCLAVDFWCDHASYKIQSAIGSGESFKVVVWVTKVHN